MIRDNDIPATYTGGVFRPERSPDLAEGAKVRLSFRGLEESERSEAWGRELFHEIRRKGMIRLDGPLPSRDRLHERR